MTATAPVPPPAAADRPYLLRCPVCREGYRDDGLRLECSRPHAPALLRTEYAATDFTPGGAPGLFRYRCWLPVVRTLPGAAASVTYRAERLGRALGLDELWVAFSGYWPERGAALETGTFKELEAGAVLGRLPEHPPVLVVASAGNTAAAFLRLCSQRELPCVIVVPEHAVALLRTATAPAPCVRVVVVEGDYTDAIELADAIAARPGFQAEGGTRNVARRDGLGTALLTAATAIGRLPDHYVQAVGSGAGAIAAHEAAKRLLAAGHPPAPRGSEQGGPRITACQNRPFAPMYHAWRAGLRALPAGAADGRPGAAAAQELTTRKPAYTVAGGMHDVLTLSGGDLLAAGNAETAAARRLFQEVEGIDIDPAPGVALAALRRAAAEGGIHRGSTVLLHVTGGGRERHAAEHRLLAVRPALLFSAAQLRTIGLDAAADLVAADAETVRPLVMGGV